MNRRTGLIEPIHLPNYVRSEQGSLESIVIRRNLNVANLEKILIERALNTSATKKEAAAELGMSLKTLYNKLSRYHLYSKFVHPHGPTKGGRRKMSHGSYGPKGGS